MPTNDSDQPYRKSVRRRLPEIPEAEKVLIELGERGGDIENLTRASRYVVGGIDAFLRSVAERIKYDFFYLKVVSKDHVGFLPKEIVYQGYGGWDTPYRIVITKPEGEVQITDRTIIRCKLTED